MTSASFRGLAALAAALMLTGCATEPESPELFFWVKPGVCAALPDSPCGADMTENAILTAVRDGRTERLLTVRACGRRRGFVASGGTAFAHCGLRKPNHNHQNRNLLWNG